MLTQQRLKEVLQYNPETGKFTRLSSSKAGRWVGREAGTVDGSGYIQVNVDGTLYKAHRLAFLYVDGTFPPNDVDHINRNRTDNRWENLRHATRSQNMGNLYSRKNPSTGLKGLYWRGSSWRVMISGTGGEHQSSHKCMLDAVATLYRLQKIIHGDFAA